MGQLQSNLLKFYEYSVSAQLEAPGLWIVLLTWSFPTFNFCSSSCLGLKFLGLPLDVLASTWMSLVCEGAASQLSSEAPRCSLPHYVC